MAEPFNCPYSLYMCEYFSPVGASVFAWGFCLGISAYFCVLAIFPKDVQLCKANQDTNRQLNDPGSVPSKVLKLEPSKPFLTLPV